MAISSTRARKTMRNRTRQQSMAERHSYDQKPEKTRDGELVSAYMCSPETAAAEFEISKKLYAQITGRSQPKARDVLMYRIIQSFKPGEVSPEEANRIGYELAMKSTRLAELNAELDKAERSKKKPAREESEQEAPLAEKPSIRQQLKDYAAPARVDAGTERAPWRGPVR